MRASPLVAAGLPAALLAAGPVRAGLADIADRLEGGAGLASSHLSAAAGRTLERLSDIASRPGRRHPDLEELLGRVDGRILKESNGLDVAVHDQNVLRRLAEVEGKFDPLVCNAPGNLFTSCTSGQPIGLSTLAIPSGENGVLTLECGECYTVDVVDTVLDIGTLDIQGSLTIPAESDLKITAYAVYLQGELVIDSDAEVRGTDGDTRALTLTLTGTTPRKFFPADSNSGVCPEGGCDVGSKPFVVAGGKLSIDALPDTCPAWTTLHSYTSGGVVLTDDQKVTKYNDPPEGCDTYMFDHGFDLSHGGWDGDKGAVSEVDDEAEGVRDDGLLHIKERRVTWHGPTIDVSYLRDCIESDTDYLFTAKVRLAPPEGSSVGDPTTCGTNGQKCLKLKTIVKMENDNKIDVSMNWDTESTAPTYGEWHDFAATVTFPEAWDVPMAKYTVLKFSGPEDGIEITVDYARLSLPDPVSFVSSCSNMIPNGDQEKNGPSAYPMRLNHDRYPPVYWPDSNVRILSIREGFGNETNSTDLDSMGGNDTDTGFNGTNFFSRVAGRYHDWHGPSFREIPPVCIQPQSVYRMSMKVRLHEPETGDAADKFPFFSELRAHYLEENGETYRHYATRKLGTSCDPIDISDGWVTCTNDFIIYDHPDPNAESGRKFTEADWYKWEMKIERNGNNQPSYADIDYDDLKFELLQGGVEGLIVPTKDVQGCWGPGSDIVIASHTLRFEDSQIATITNVTAVPGAPDMSKIVVDGAIIPATTLEDGVGDPYTFAAEIGLLSRNVIIQSDNTNDDRPHIDGSARRGGHITVMHTPSVAQEFGGVELRYMGQDMVADRHPFLLYQNRAYVKDTNGNLVDVISPSSVIKKNSIRDSYSRGIVIDGTDNVTVAENVAYKTRGHVYAIIDGTEENIVFQENLGIFSRENDGVLPGSWWVRDQSVYTFYTTTPKNTWIGNVAAGSRVGGFGFHLADQVRGESSDEGLNGRPRSYGLVEFRDNVAHSNYHNGIWLYEFEPTEGRDLTAEFKNNIVYKNRDRGWYVDHCRDVSVDGGIISDTRVGFMNWRSSHVELHNLRFFGETDKWKEIAAIQEAERFCRSPWHNVDGQDVPVGIQWSTYDTRWYAWEERNIIADVEFAGFDEGQSPGCTQGVPLLLKGQWWGEIDFFGSPHYNYPTTISNFNVNDADDHIMNACWGAERFGTNDVLMEIKEGPGVLISSTDHMIDMAEFAGATCTSHEGCVSTCAPACLRQVEFGVAKEASTNMVLRVKNDATGDTVDIESNIYRGEGQVHSHRHRYFYVALPIGEFTVYFIDKDTNEIRWPIFVSEKWEQAPSCDTHANPGDVTIHVPELPEGYCDELIRNGDMESGSMAPWNLDDEFTRIELVPGGGFDGSTGLAHRNRRSEWNSFGQFLDQRCIKAYAGKQFEITAQVRLFNKDTGEPMDCDPNSNEPSQGCPEVSLVRWFSDPDAPPVRHIAARTQNPMAETLRDYNKDTFNTLHGLFNVKQNLNDAFMIYFEIEGFSRNADIVVDNVSISPLVDYDSPSRCDDLAINGGLELGNDKFWDTHYSSNPLILVQGKDGPDDLAISMPDRFNQNQSPRMTLKTGCLEEGERYIAEVNFKITDEDGEVVACTPRPNRRWFDPEIECPNIKEFHDGVMDDGEEFRTYIELANGVTPASADGWSNGGPPIAADGWYSARGAFYATAKQERADKILVWLEMLDPKYSLTMDEMHIRPIEDACENLILNPNFENDLSFWNAFHTYHTRIEHIADGGIRTRNRENWEAGFMQHIDTRCLNAGEDFVVAGSFKLLNSTGHGASCFDTGEDIENDPEKCPTVRMIGRNCDNDDVDFQIQNELGIVQGWEPENFNDFNTRITISQDLSTCQEVMIMAGYKITTEKDILSKSMNMIPATASPTNSPTVPGTASPTGSPTFKPTGPTFAPTLRPTMVATPLPPVGETSTIGDGVVSVALSAANTLTTLSRVNVDEEGIESSVVPIARSYNSNHWEKAAGRIVRNTMFDDSWWCHDSACENNLPMLGDGQLYKLTTTTASLRSLEGKSECARFFESATFGTSTEDLEACMNPSGSATPTMTPTTSSPTISAMPTRADLGPGASIETWTNVGGTTLNAIDWNSQPNKNDVISGDGDAVLEGPVNNAENYAERIRTYLVPPVTGSYTFWIASDDQGSLLLSSDADPANAIEIASVPYWANPREYGKYPEQRSDAISLVAGEVYFLEAKMKEGGGGDNLSVAWEYPGQSQQVIPASYGRIPIPQWSESPTMAPTSMAPTTMAPTTTTAMPTSLDLGTGASIETWTNVGGTTLNAIDWNSQPNQNDVISGDGDAVLEGPVNNAENYAERIRTYLVPPVTGSYTFWIASDDQGSLLLSSDSDPANAIEIASVPYWANPREYGKYPEQRSDAISLVAGEVYFLEAKMKEGGGGDNLSVAWEYPGQSQQVIPASYGRIPLPQARRALPDTGFTLDTWTNVGGTTLNAIDWNSNPTFSTAMFPPGNAVLEGPVNNAENYAERIRTYLVPPVTGSYTFWIASDDQGSLLLSSDSDPANAIEIASVPYWANPREYGKYPEQRSDAISLVAGEVYFLEAKMKEGGGGDNLSVAWEYPGQSQQVIPASYGRINPPANNESRRLAVADNTIITDSIIPWLQTQMDPDDTPMTSHREFFRSRANSVWPSPEAIGRGGKPCSAGSRWRQRAFSPMEVNDRFNPYKLNIVPIQSYCHNPNASATHHVLVLDGYPRTAVEGLDLSQFVSSPEEVGWHLDFEICHLYPLHIRVFQEFPNQNPCIRVFQENPIVDFPESMCHIGQNIDLSSANTSPVGDNDILLQDDLSDDLCETLPETASKVDPPIFGQLSDGSHVIFDARLILLDNTAESPVLDGGGEVSLETNEITLCSSAPRTFLNEDTCVLSTDPSACAIDKSVEALIPLNEENILQLHDLTGRYTYAIQGLVVVDNMANEVLHSCTPGYRSRWEKEANQQCENPTNIDAMTNQTLTDLIIANEGDPNPTLRDITFPDSGAMCDLSTGVGIKIQVGIDCWTQVHHDHLGVYDVTYWTLDDTHPGNMVALAAGRPNPIKKWMDESGSPFLIFPSTHPFNPIRDHPILRWKIHSPKFDYVGRFGDIITYKDLPTGLRTIEVAEHYGATLNSDGANIIVCGSPGEIANDPNLDLFDVASSDDRGDDRFYRRQKMDIWTTIATKSQDQLRQKIAWALAQVLVAVTTDVRGVDRNTEQFVNYYDIFVRNAFGNYRDILKECSYSFLMASHLTYLRSTSTAYEWEVNRLHSKADENYAREVMQLFSFGMIKLNMDGSPVRDESGNTIATYTNDLIMSLAKVWTGFDSQLSRGNIEDQYDDGNKLDPMRIVPDWRDKFPKRDLNEGYLGDGYPLCSDITAMPSSMFLNRGATYRLLGSSSLPELVDDPAIFATDPDVVKFVLHDSSALKAELCQDNGNGCEYPNKVTLATNLSCTDGSSWGASNECDVETVRVVQVAPDIHYEYLPPACVYQPFFNDAVKLTRRDGAQTICADERVAVAQEACCDGNGQAVRNNEFDGERMTFAKSQQRCESMVPPRETCDFDAMDVENDSNAFHWAWDGVIRTVGDYEIPSCAVRVKVNTEGLAGIVYRATGASLSEHVDLDNRNYFQVYWEDPNNLPTPENNCGGICISRNSIEAGGSQACECAAHVVDSQAFNQPPTKKEILSTLKIGSAPPASYREGYFTTEDIGDGVIVHNKGGAFGQESIFEITDNKQRTHYLKNEVSTVHVGEIDSPYKFRNPSHFMSMVPTESNERDAHTETDAVLDEYFYNDSTAPFISSRILQRLGFSNPSPRLISAVATAFTQGTYTTDIGVSFGDGRYGSLAATVAAAFLDRESRSALLLNDPSHGSLREPLVKIISAMRNMAFESAADKPVIKLMDMMERIGEDPYGFPTVFNFYLPEYVPDGVLAAAALAAPESQLMDMPRIVELMNGLFSLSQHGLTDYDRGFAPWSGLGGGYLGELTYEPQVGASPEEIIDDMADLLTSGRLSDENREIIVNAYNAHLGSTRAKLQLAMQYMFSTPEFHSTQTPALSGVPRPTSEGPTGRGDTQGYKAIVYIMLTGGYDSYNVLAPHTCTLSPEQVANNETSIREQYENIRTTVSLDTMTDLLPIDASSSNQQCETFGIHNSIPIFKNLYDGSPMDGQDPSLLWFANTGILTKPVDKSNYRDVSQITQLFAHNTQQDNTRRIDPFDDIRGTGVLGRIMDVLYNNDYLTSGLSVAGSTVTLAGQPGQSPKYSIINNADDITEFNPTPLGEGMDETIFDLNNATTSNSGGFGETWASKLSESVALNKKMRADLQNSVLETENTFCNQGGLCGHLETVARMIQVADNRKVTRESFYATYGSWDHHAMLAGNLANRLEHVNSAVESFVAEMRAQGKYDDVTVVFTSDFARTLDPNGNIGTDHGWGGNYAMFGGAVNGGRILGKYPDDILNSDGSMGAGNVGRGRMIPSTSWDSVWNGLAQWMGVETEEELDTILPNRYKFANDRTNGEINDDLFSKEDLFRTQIPARRNLRKS